jgi:hypothetical protein
MPLEKQPSIRYRLPFALVGLVAIVLTAIALRPAVSPPSVYAQSPVSAIYVEPGVTIIRSPDGSGQVQGKVVIDLQSGDVWGFPTSSAAPYPVDQTSTRPPVSKPVYLGRFDLAAMKRP